MKLIIDIPEDKYKTFKNGMYSGMLDAELFQDIKNGTPLDNLRSEIEQVADEEQKHDEKWTIGLRYAVKIIDKYREGDKE